MAKIFASLVLFHDLCHLLVLFSKLPLSHFFLEYHQSAKLFGSRSGQQFLKPDLGPICLQRLSANDTRSKNVVAVFAIDLVMSLLVCLKPVMVYEMLCVSSSLEHHL